MSSVLTMVGWDDGLVARPAFPKVCFARMTVEVFRAMCDCRDDYRGFRVRARILTKTTLECRLIHVHTSYIHENLF